MIHTIHNLFLQISKISKEILLSAGKLLGVDYEDNNIYYNKTNSALWVFIAGVPIGFLILGESFSIGAWFLIVIFALIIINTEEIFTKQHNNN